MRFGVLLPATEVGKVQRTASLAEEAGFDLVAVGDSPLVFREFYVCLTAIANSTNAVPIAGLATNVLSRHLAVTASAAASLTEFTSGRFILTVGSGDSAARALGLRPAPLSELRTAVSLLRDLLSGAEVEIQGQRVRLEGPIQSTPLYMVGEGPATLRLAGEIANGIVVGSGISEAAVRFALDSIQTGLDDRATELIAPPIWFYVRANVGPDRRQLLEDIRHGLAANARRAFARPLEDQTIPEHLRQAVSALQGQYDYREHMVPYGATNWRLTDAFGLTDYLVDRFAILGTPDECLNRLATLQGVGIENIIISGNVPNPEELIVRWGRDIISQVRA